MGKLPVLFIGHGSPMNALGGNAYARALTELGQKLPRPRAILAISAHWETNGTHILDRDPPPTIHDFQGFPEELYKINYPAPGSSELVSAVETCLSGKVKRASNWGLDHGTWAVLHHLYPNADVPVTQLSLDRGATFAEHLQLGEKLRPLRDRYLILCSGNIVHNLRKINWQNDKSAFPWAVTFDEQIAKALQSRQFNRLADFDGFDKLAAGESVPTPEHFVPLLYAAGAAESGDVVSFLFTEILNGSISMRSVMFGGL